MNEVDFAVAFLLIISVLTYSVVSVSNKISGDFSLFTEKRLEESASSLSKQLLSIQDEKSLVSNFKKIQASFQEEGSYQHSETLSVIITPVVDKIHVYDRLLNEVPSTVDSNGGSVTVSFSLDFSPNEKKYVDIFYDGAPTSSIAYASASNITSVILSEEDALVVSQQKCSRLKALDYQAARSEFGFLNNFNVSGCDYGSTPPATANVVVESVPALMERADGTLYSDFVRIEVWQ